ncbi:MAG: biotin--[acetyl-CoA-carboxylase] ligase [Acidimicrobiales bacterium]|nr:biotin--[acetyl-CoA-carboxylase] ligase [Acidimicrobiales bacterium]
MPSTRATSALASGPGSRFSAIRWREQTASTNADALAEARTGHPEGLVVVADHQTAGRGRQGRTWTAPPGASLLVSVLLRPPRAVVEACATAVAVAAAEAVEEVAGFAPRLKWPNDLVWPGDGSGPDRKLSGILAEADWAEGGTAAVVVGIGINVSWPAELPAELADIAIACNHITDRAVDREDLLVALLQALDRHYTALVADGDRQALLDEWRRRSATLGRRVRVELDDEDVVGTAVDVTPDGHLVVAPDEGPVRTFAVGDVIHLRTPVL